ncbi:hypothetical protein DPX16_7696, partial [Anabarilius grahami]
LISYCDCNRCWVEIDEDARSRGKWIPSPNCTNIAVLICELTFDELHWDYFVRVKTTFKGTNSNWTTTSKSFQPYGDTRLSSPDVEISSDQKSITINFSHRLELKPEIKLKFLLYLFEKSPAGESEVIAYKDNLSTSESPHIVSNVPSGKNYCVSVSASQQQASKNNFRTTKCTFLLDSTRSFVLTVCIVAILLITFSTGIVVTFGCFYDMRLKIKNLHIPKALIFIKVNNRVIERTPEETITVILPVNTEDYDSALEEEIGSQFYHKRENITNVIINPSSIANVNPPEQSEEAETSNQCLYTLATDMEQSQESEISKKDNDDMHPVTPASLCTCISNHSESSTFLQATTVNVFVNSEEVRYCAEETPCSSGNDCEREVHVEEKEEEEEDDVSLLADHSSESGYEPRHAMNDL